MEEKELRKLIKETLSTLKDDERPFKKIKEITTSISNNNMSNEMDEKKIKVIFPYLKRNEVLEMYECAGGSSGSMVRMGIGAEKNSVDDITNNDFNGYKKEIKYGEDLFKMGLAHYHATKKQKTVDGEIESKVGWYLTNAGKKVIDYIMKIYYEPYVLVEIKNNPYLNKVVERVGAIGDSEFIISFKEKSNPSGLWFNAKNNNIRNIEWWGTSDMIDSIEDMEKSLERLGEAVKNSKMLEKEFKKIKLKDFSEVYK